ncbi:FUSC family protein [Gordonia rhizosphera]|nr:FUSC family protein [Gordonia rhizosphera]
MTHAVRPRVWRDAMSLDIGRVGIGAPVRVGVAVALMLVAGGLLGHHDVAGFASLGALVSAFCRPDPYPQRWPRLVVLAVATVIAVAVGAAVGVADASAPTEVAVISELAGVAVVVLSALRIVGPGAVIFAFAATGAAGFAHTATDVTRVLVATAIGATCGVLASLAPWIAAGFGTRAEAGPQHESVWRALARVTDRALLATGMRVTAAAAVSAALAGAAGLSHPLWAAMGAVAAMQGVAYHRTVTRGVQRLIGNVLGAVIAAAMLAVPLGYWGAVAAIVVFQIVAEVASTINYTITTLAVTPMALLLTGLNVGLSPEVAVDRAVDTAIGVIVGIVVAALTIAADDAHGLVGSPS